MTFTATLVKLIYVTTFKHGFQFSFLSVPLDILIAMLVRNNSADNTFVETGFSNRKKALERFEKHQSSLSHHDAMDQVVRKNRDVGEMLNKRLKTGRCWQLF